MQPDLNSQLRDTILTKNIEAISDLIEQGARLDPSLISSVDLDDAAQAQFEADKTKLLESFYAIFNKNPGSSDEKNLFSQHCINIFEQATVLSLQLNYQGQGFVSKLIGGCQEAMLSKLKSWREALRGDSALNLTAKEDPGNDLALPHSRYQEGKDKKPNFSYPNKEKMMMLRFAHRFTTHNRFTSNRFTEPQQLCQDILNFYTSHPDSPEWLKNITVLPAGKQPSATAGGLSAAADEPITEITLEKALRLCVDLVNTELRPGHYSGDYPLHQACEDGSAFIVELLLKNGADIHAKNDYGLTPLHVAARNGNTEVVALLLILGADINVKDSYDYTPLHVPALNGNTEVVDLLLQNGADINAKGLYGDTPLHWAAESGKTEVVDLLLQHNADPNVKDQYSETPLHTAVIFGKTEVVKLLLEQGADPEEKDRDGDTLLHRAAQGGHTAVVALLLEQGADINAKDAYSNTPLHWAAKNGKTEVVERLLEQGADIYSKNDNGQTPRELALENGHTQCADLLRPDSVRTIVTALATAAATLYLGSNHLRL